MANAISRTNALSSVPQGSLMAAGRGIILLAVGAALVGVAIVVEGTGGRAINGVGVVAWIAGTATLVWQLRRSPGFAWRLPLTALVAIGIATMVRPNDLVGALIGFSIAGAAIAFTARQHPAAWAALVPAIYLPAHVAISIGRSIVSGGVSVRVDPPPTAAIVPLVMVAAAVGAGVLVANLRRR